MKSFQSTPPRRRRLTRFDKNWDALIFNPRLREGGDQCHAFLTPLGRAFSIHASAKEATPVAGIYSFLPYKFSIHASAKEATNMAMNSNAIQQFSIHASAKEATNFFSDNRISFVFSIHASAKEATPCKRFLVRLRFYFQSTPPRRRRPLDSSLGKTIVFSIHASAKEATKV